VDLLPVEQGVVRALEAARAEGASCIACPVDYVALDLLRAAAERGVRIPEDLSTFGFDGLGDGLDLVGLATVRLPVAEVASRAVERMEELMVSAQDDAEGPPPGRGGGQGDAAPADGPTTARHEAIAGRLVPGRTLSAPPEHLRR